MSSHVEDLSRLFEDLDPTWIESLVSQFPTATVEFLTEQCLARCEQINAEQHKANHNQKQDIDQKQYIDLTDDNSPLSPAQHNFLYSQPLIDSDDEVIMADVVTDQGPSMSLLSSVPKELCDWFESFSKSLSITFQPGLLEILLHLEMVRYNTTFAFSPKPNAVQTHDAFIQSLEFLLQLLSNLQSKFDDPKYRMFPRSDNEFCEKFNVVEGSEILLKYTGWTLIETDQADNGGLYVYNEDNDKQYLHAIIELLTMYRDYLKGDMKPDNNYNHNKARPSSEWMDPHGDKANNFLSIFEDDDVDEEEDKLDEKELLITPSDDAYITRQPSADTDTQESRISDMIRKAKANGVDVMDLPRDLNVNEFVLRQRNKSRNIYEHAWPSSIPGYALMEEHKKNNINVYTYSWDEFPSHRYKFLALECEMNKFSRIGVSISLGNCRLDDITSGSSSDDVQIFKSNDKIEISTQIGPFEKKVVFTVKYVQHKQLSFSWRYYGSTVTLNDITEYIKHSNDMLSDATEKYLRLYRQYDLHKLADKVGTLYNILTGKLNVSCFIDLEFPPLSASLMSKTQIDNNAQDMKAFEGLIWRRAIDFAEYPHVFGPAIMLSDVQQGNLGNCGFAASLTAISVFPQLIKKLIIFPAEESVSSIGLYEVTLCHNGIWRQYTIDDLIPCNYGGSAAFTRHENGNLLWVSLIEKCAAKSYGGYDRLIAFCKLNAFNDLTGCPVEEIDFDIFAGDANVLWKHLMDWSNNKYTVMTLAATIERSKRSISDLGITGNHAFTLIRVVEVENIRLIQIRNPHGQCNDGEMDRWKGDYSRYNHGGEWTQTLRDIVRPELDANDGTFWMCLHDFEQYFAAASLCHLLVLNREYRICRMNTAIVYNYNSSDNTEDILYPKLILDLSAMDNSDELELEWLGIQQENLRSQYATAHEYLDVCLLIGHLLYPNDSEKCMSDSPAYIQPVRITECRKSKTEFEKIFAQLRGGQKYVLIPYSTGITFHKNYKTLKQHQTRNVNLSLYMKHKSGLHVQQDDNIKLEYQKTLNIQQMTPILTHFVQVLGNKQQSGDLEYVRATFGSLAFSAVRHSKLEQMMRGTFSFDLVNMLPAIGFDQGFILKNNICRQIDESQNDLGCREWQWIYTVHDLKCMQTHLFVIGQYERFKRQRWKFHPSIFFSSMPAQQNRNNNNNNNNGSWFGGFGLV
eukprot:152204_1